MLDLLMTVASGGATGILGSVVGGAFKWLDRRDAAREAEALRAHELALQRLHIETRGAELESEERIAQADARARADEAASATLVASYRHDRAAAPASPWAADVKAMVRPALTFALIALTAAVYFTIGADADDLDLRAYVAHTIVYTTSAATLWWFGDRAREMRR